MTENSTFLFLFLHKYVEKNINFTTNSPAEYVTHIYIPFNKSTDMS